MMLDLFISYLLSKVGCSLYVWGAQGESIKSIVREWVTKKETSQNNVNRVMSLLDKLLKDDLFFYDCSGLGVDWLLKQKLIKSDMTANSMYNLCSKVSKSSLKKGDWVFVLNSSGVATHIGYVVDDKLNVVESAGRDRGVIQRPLSQGSPNGAWNAFGRPDKLFPELNKNVEFENTIIFNRILKLTSPRMTGEDVRVLQKAIGADQDGVFGPGTEKLLIEKQKKLFPNNPSEWDGKVGKKTIVALGLKWIN